MFIIVYNLKLYIIKKHYTYKITNTKTNEYYLGVRSCVCEIKDDPYMGSSTIWTKLYIKEHCNDLEPLKNIVFIEKHI